MVSLFLCFSPSPVAPHSWQPVWSSCKGAPPIYPQPYTFHLSSLPEEAKKVLGQWSNTRSKVMRSRELTTRPSPPPHRRSNPVPSCANLYISICCSSGIPSTLLHRVHIPPCQTGCTLGKGCGQDGTGHLCGSSPASRHWAVLSFSLGRESKAEDLRVGVGSGVPAAAGGGGQAQRKRQAEAMLPSPGLTCLAQPPLPSYQAQSPPGHSLL